MFSSDKEMKWVKTIKPWMEAVNAAGKGIIEIDGYPNGALGRALPQQSQIVLNDVADIAFVIPGVTPGRYPDNDVIICPDSTATCPKRPTSQELDGSAHLQRL